MLEYSRQNWHYRLLHWIHKHDEYTSESSIEHRIPKNLCPYMRQVIGGMILAPFLALWRSLPNAIQEHTDLGKALSIWLLLSHFVAWLVNGALLKAGVSETGHNYAADYRPWLGWEVFFIGIGGSLFIVGLLYGFESIKDRISQHYRNQPRKKNQSIGLMKDFIEAKHNKICPEIQFTD